MTGPTIASHGAPDPIFAAIEAYKAAYAALDDCSHRKNLLEEGIMDAVAGIKDRSERYSQLKAMQANSPEWIFLKEETGRLHEAETDAMMGMVNVQPTSFAGAAALVRYILQYEENFAWPDPLEDEDGKLRSWNYFFCENLLELISKAA